ncbi:hypothetical protein, partial [Bradyrhizobium canariense]|uniref:hypothetical protein n=1 Tax=Bradyrhizobium canariense TaxID=255045 RepID=UPI001178C8DB
MTTKEDEDRREFLKTCGRFAAVTPPAMTLLLSTSLTSTAIARSGAQDGAGYSGGGGSSHSVFDNDPHSATEDHSTKAVSYKHMTLPTTPYEKNIMEDQPNNKNKRQTRSVLPYRAA